MPYRKHFQSPERWLNWSPGWNWHQMQYRNDVRARRFWNNNIIWKLKCLFKRPKYTILQSVYRQRSLQQIFQVIMQNQGNLSFAANNWFVCFWSWSTSNVNLPSAAISTFLAIQMSARRCTCWSETKWLYYYSTYWSWNDCFIIVDSMVQSVKNIQNG